MQERVLVTGGAGFIGAHLARELLENGYAVRALDNLTPQVHEETGHPPYLPDEVELVVGDICDASTVRRALDDVDHVVHLAARVGVGQSMYEIASYSGANTYGTGVLLEGLIDRPIQRMIVASSMSVYGEGLYADASGRLYQDRERSRSDVEAGRWDPSGDEGIPLMPLPTPESKMPNLSSIYALTKFDQERMCLIYGRSYGVPVTALRFFNVYGPYQALSNPYTGVLAIFAARLLNGKPPMVFEDGNQRRDFVSVKDVARACRLALESNAADGHVLNVGSGRSVSVLDIARKLAEVLNLSIDPEITGRYRIGDIRHCFADISRAREVIGFVPQISLEDGMAELAEWLQGQIAVDRVDLATKELTSRGLTI